MLTLLLLQLVLLSLARGCDPELRLVVERVLDHYQVQLSSYENVVSVTVAGEQVTGAVQYEATDCEQTEYSAEVHCVDPLTQEISTATLTADLAPIPLDQLVGFKDSDYDVHQDNVLVDAGGSATLTCQTEAERARYPFQPIYTWLKSGEYRGGVVVAETGTDPTLVVEAAECGDAGYYYCKVRRCPQHNLLTKACNSNNLVVQQPKPKVTTSKCKIFGDPHIQTFDGAMYAYKGHCWYVLAMDGLTHKWFVYGQFSACGDKSTCLESVSVVTRTSSTPGGVQIVLLRGFAMNVNGQKTFIGRGDSHEVGGVRVTYTGTKLDLVVPEYKLQVQWDGLASAKILVDLNKPTLGMCGDNNGDAGNDYSTFYDGTARTSDQFGDVWAVGKGCKLSAAFSVSSVPSSMFNVGALFGNYQAVPTIPLSYLMGYCKDAVYEDSQLQFLAAVLDPALLDSYLDACGNDAKNTENGFYSYSNFPMCIALTALAEEAADQGLCVRDWHVKSACPDPQYWREEAVRIGCIWTQAQADLVLA